MKIKLIGHTPDQDLKVKRNNPWQAFIEELMENGFEIVTGEVEKNYFDILIVNSHSPRSLKRAKELNVKKRNIFMIYWEPSVTNPKIHSENVRNLYGNVYTPSREWQNKLNGYYFFWPQVKIEGELQTLNKWSKRKNKSIMILANKFSASRGQNYTLRRNTDLIKDDSGNYLVDLFGEAWNKGRMYDLSHFFGKFIKTPKKSLDLFSWISLGKKQLNFLGQAPVKTKTASKYRINLVIENSGEYVSEKIFAAHVSQNIIVYVGANLKFEGINNNLAIQCEPNVDEISSQINYLINLPVENQYKIMKKQWQIAKNESKRRSNKLVLRNLANSIVKKIEST
jgi:hypothetical protein